MNIEESAFKDRKTLANLNAIDLLDIIEFLQLDRKQWINQFSKTHNESIDIQKENQELKKQLEEWKELLNKFKIQQKEFIKWLENYINLFDKKDIYEQGSCDTIEEILQKYREIIGDINDKK